MAGEKMTTATHEMSSTSSFGKGDDPNFVPELLAKKGRTGSLLQAVKSFGYAVSNKTVSTENSHVGDAQKRLLQCITREDEVSGVRKICQDWYLTYLDARIIEVWSIAAKVLHGTATDAATPDIRGKTCVYEILILVSQSLEGDREFTLTDIVIMLKEKNLINDDAGELAVQLVFQCLSWLTALFNPLPTPSTTDLFLQQTGDDSRRHSATRKTIIRHLSVPITAARLPIQRLLRKFGSLLPEPASVRRLDAAGGLEAGPEDIIAPYVYFQNLKLLNVKIEWVDILNQHLEFDRRHRTLKIFRSPSICRLMYRDQKGTILDLVCHEVEGEHDEQSRSPHLQVAEIDAFLSEVILSYRLIFGCQRRSRGHILRELEEVKDGWRREARYDPLLEILCTENKDSREIQDLYKDLDAKHLDAKDFEDYVSVDEFPFLGPRLYDLQRFSMAQQPHSWKRLWYDQRNITLWFTTWAVVIIGGGTLIFQMLQLAFQVYQPFNGGGG